jgi:hypothetical protein
MTEVLPVDVLAHPHWRINLRPAEYRQTRLRTLSDCMATIEATKVRLRGWDYPHLSRKPGQTGQGNDYIASWVDSMGHIEYWRLYQSAQFLHLFAVREAVQPEWSEKLRRDAKWHIGDEGVVAQAPGFFSLLNVIYTVTEVFEFASRLCQRGTYTGAVVVEIRIRNAKGFGLIPDVDRAWFEHRSLSSDDVGYEWTIESAELVAATAQYALNSVTWLFQRFGWLNPPEAVIARDQERFLRGIL